MFCDLEFLVQFLQWLITNLGIVNQCKSNTQKRSMRMVESRFEHWKLNIKKLDKPNSTKVIALKHRLLCCTEKISMFCFGQFKVSC